ncbi:hypothetical protein ACFL1G_02090 [Planctomycetota bacterium]
MSVKEKAKHILAELKGHAPFTAFGAVIGILFMILFRNMSGAGTHAMFAIFHPVHVVLSAIVTASMIRMHAAKRRFLLVLIIGYFGSIGIATLSDIIIPHIGSEILGLDVPTHVELHHEEDSQEHTLNATDEQQGDRIHLGFIEEWYIVNPAALLGIFIAFFLPRTKFPHAGHILISTWASSSYLLMNIQSQITAVGVLGILVTLFIATWLPCCISDIIFPLLFVKSDLELTNACFCSDHAHHSHPHKNKHTDKCGKRESQ